MGAPVATKVMNLAIEVDVDSDGAIREFKQLKSAAGGVGDGASKGSRGLNLMGAAIAGLGAYAAIKGIKALASSIVSIGTEVVQTGARFETLGIQMKSITGSSENADKAMAWITDFTANTPYQLEQVANSFVKLKAFGLEPMEGVMQTVADMTSYLGGETDTLNSIVLALGKANTVGKLSMEEMRMMMERGVPVIDILAQKLGVSNEKILDMSKKGQLGRDSIDLLIEGMGELAGGSSAALMDSFNGMWSNLQDQITLSANELATSGILDTVKGFLRDILDYLQTLRDSGFIEMLGSELAMAMEAAKPAFQVIVDMAYGLAAGFAYALKAYHEFQLGLLDTTRMNNLEKQFEKQVKTLQDIVKAGNEGTAAYRHAKNAMEQTASELIKLTDQYDNHIESIQKAEDVLELITVGFNEGADAVKEHRKELEGVIEAQEEAKETGEDLGASVVSQSASSSKYAEILEKKVYKNLFKVIEAENIAKLATDKLDLALQDAMHAAEQMADEGPQFFDTFEGAFSDMLGKGFTGELDSFRDLWDSVWADMAKSMVGIIGDAFSGALEDGGTVGGVFARFNDNLGDMGAGQRIGMGIGGAGMAMQGIQSGDPLQGMLGGAMAGFAVGGPVGAIVGGAIGLLGGLLGGGDDEPQSRLEFFPSTGSGAKPGGASRGGQNISAEQWDLMEKEFAGLYREMFMSYRKMLMSFGDVSLFDLVGGLPSVTTDGWIDMSAEDMMEWLGKVKLPELFESQFYVAMQQGLQGLGMEASQIDALFAELDLLAGEERLVALTTFIQALKGMNDVLEGSDWENLKNQVESDVVGTFITSMGEVGDRIELLRAGWESLTLVQRAEELQEIGGLFESVLNGVIDMLRQIDQMRQSINAGWDAIRESRMLDDMTDSEKGRYFQSQIESLMRELSSATTLEEINRINSELMGYVQNLNGLGLQDNPLDPMGYGESMDEYLDRIINQAQEMANQRLDLIEDELQAAYEELAEAAREARDALLELAGGGTLGGGGGEIPDPADPGDDGLPWGKGGEDGPYLTVEPEIIVNVYNNSPGLESTVEVIVQRMMNSINNQTPPSSAIS